MNSNSEATLDNQSKEDSSFSSAYPSPKKPIEDN
jgi:hypothetical protein